MIAFLHVWFVRGTVGACLAVLLVWSSAVEAATLTGRPLVLDADTVIMSGERIRLKGIDAPETTQRCLDGEQQSYPCGQVATNALIDKIGISPLTCVGETRDRYGRLLATCYLDDLDVNGWLVQHGYALAYQQYSTRYAAEEAEAKSLKRGMWAGTFTPPWDHRRGARGDVSCGVAAPHDAVLLFRRKDPKRGVPAGVARWVPLPRSRLLGLRNSLRSDSPRPHLEFGTRAPPRPQAPLDLAPFDGALLLLKTKTTTLDP